MKKRKAIIIALAIVLLVGVFMLSFGYFSVIIDNTTNPERVNVQAGDLELTFTNGNGSITQTLQFGDAPIEKTFTIVNSGTKDLYAKISWLDLINTYSSGSLVYKLYESETEGVFSGEPILVNNVPTSLNASTIKLADRLLVKADSTTKSKTTFYKLIIELVDLPNTEQIFDENTQFSTRFTLGYW